MAILGCNLPGIAFFYCNNYKMVLESRAMSVKAVIYTVDGRMDLNKICQLINNNFNNLAKNTENQVNLVNENIEKAETHNELNGRDVDDCHPVSAITGLNATLKSINSTIKDINTTLEKMTEVLEDHEERIKALEKE